MQLLFAAHFHRGGGPVPGSDAAYCQGHVFL